MAVMFKSVVLHGFRLKGWDINTIPGSDGLLFLCLLQAFVKTVKNKAYYKRFQVKYRRRRGMFLLPHLGHTDGIPVTSRPSFIDLRKDPRANGGLSLRPAGRLSFLQCGVVIYFVSSVV